jgi:hypothetical protein
MPSARRRSRSRKARCETTVADYRTSRFASTASEAAAE